MCSARPSIEYWRDHSAEPAHVAVFDDSVKPIADAGQAELIASDAKLTDEITMIPTPGHSPGHMSIHIKSDGEEGLLTGDVAHHPCQMAHLDWSSTADSDAQKSAETRRELFSRFADTPMLVIGGHFNAGHIKREGDAFKFIALGSMVRRRAAPSRTSVWPILRDARQRAPQDEGLQCGQSALNFPALFHKPASNQRTHKGVLKNEACSLRRKGCGKARPDR